MNIEKQFDIYSLPSLHIIGRILGAKNFNATEMYVKYQLKVGMVVIQSKQSKGEKWYLLAGTEIGESFTTTMSPIDTGTFFPLEQPFEAMYSTGEIRGWPKILLEVWQVSSAGRHQIAGYGQMTIPSSPGEFEMKVHCWRPKPGFFDRMIGAYPELFHKDILVSSDSRYSFQAESTGEVLLEIGILANNFHNHGVYLSQKEYLNNIN